LRLIAILFIATAAAASAQAPTAARQAELRGDFAAAEKAYETEVQASPSAETWQRLGLARHLQSKFDTAIPAFREALRLDPSLWTSRLFLGICLYRLNRFDEAETELEHAGRQAPQRDPGRDEIDYWTGATLIARKRLLAGLIVIERLLARSPSRLDALQLAAQVYADLGSSLWNQVAEQNFASAPGYEVHGHALEADGNIEGALDAYRRSQALDPRRAGPGTEGARVLLSQGKAAEARAVLEQELKIAPSDPKACYYACLAAVQLGYTAEAAPLLEIAVRWATRDPEPSIALAEVYLALGQRDRAADSARRALSVAPASTAARELLQAAGQQK
jgi:tetratricopeptide (TPR) repeat protein